LAEAWGIKEGCIKDNGGGTGLARFLMMIAGHF